MLAILIRHIGMRVIYVPAANVVRPFVESTIESLDSVDF
jgi:hypothetical protein